MSVLALTVAFNTYANAQEGFYYVPNNWVMDVKNPNFLWAQQNEPTEFQLGIDSVNGSYIMSNNTIRYKNPNGTIEDQVVTISPSNDPDKTISFFTISNEPAIPNDTILTYSENSGLIKGIWKPENKEITYKLDTYTNKIYNADGEAVVTVGSEVNKVLVAYFMFDFYTRFSRR